MTRGVPFSNSGVRNESEGMRWLLKASKDGSKKLTPR